MALATIDENGLHLPDYPTVLEDVKARFRGIYGDDLYLEPDSQDGQLCAVFALALHDAYTLAGSVYNAYSPATAQGTGLSRMVKINGLRRKPSGRSTVDLRLVGQAGTVIRGGMAGDAAGKRWLLPDEVAIPQSGEITVTATAEESGDIRAAAGDIVKILTPARGWQSVGNPAAALPGAAVETDAELRRRQAISTALPSLTVFEGTLGAVASIPGVTRSRGYENDGGVPDADGIPGHSICMVVEGIRRPSRRPSPRRRGRGPGRTARPRRSCATSSASPTSSSSSARWRRPCTPPSPSGLSPATFPPPGKASGRTWRNTSTA